VVEPPWTNARVSLTKLTFIARDEEHHVQRHFSCLNQKDTKKKQDDSSRKKHALSSGSKINKIGGVPFFDI